MNEKNLIYLIELTIAYCIMMDNKVYKRFLEKDE